MNKWKSYYSDFIVNPTSNYQAINPKYLNRIKAWIFSEHEKIKWGQKANQAKSHFCLSNWCWPMTSALQQTPWWILKSETLSCFSIQPNEALIFMIWKITVKFKTLSGQLAYFRSSIYQITCELSLKVQRQQCIFTFRYKIRVFLLSNFKRQNLRRNAKWFRAWIHLKWRRREVHWRR